MKYGDGWEFRRSIHSGRVRPVIYRHGKRIKRVSNYEAARQHADEIEERERRALLEKERNCMSCRRPFWSLHSGHRMCDDCKRSSFAYEGHV